MLIYKIHPAIGVGRVGNSLDKFFVGPETPGHPGVEIQGDGTETSIANGKYKEAGKIKRQAVRFRIFEYDAGASGVQSVKREITANEAKITWKVDLVNRKAALDHMPPILLDPAPPHKKLYPRVAARARNPMIVGAARAGLVIHDPREHSISGTKRTGVFFDQGKFLDTPVFLGELQTDKDGRLLVLGGRGNSSSVPPGRLTTNFANNDLWHDDVSDGPVTAKIQFPGEAERDVDAPAWVTFAPPDFAPGIGGIVTLYDVAFQAAIDSGLRRAENMPSFRRHILPIILRAANLRFVGDQDDDVTGANLWNALPRDPMALSVNTNSAATLRASVVQALTSPTIESILDDATLPAFIATYLDQYGKGTFLSDLDAPLPTLSDPDALDRAALEACVGLNFFPGIEASQTMRTKIYSEAFRFDATLPEVTAGFLTQVMACPWQADFKECEKEWWPSQRPDMVMNDADNIPGSRDTWAKGILTRDDMVAKWASLPFVVPAKSSGGESVFVAETP